MVGKGASDGDPLAFATRHLRWATGRARGQPDLVEQLQTALTFGSTCHSCSHHRDLDVLQCREVGEQVVKLEDQPDGVPAVVVELTRTTGQELTVDGNRAARRFVEGSEQVDQRRFPATRRPGHGNELARSNFQVEACQCADSTVVELLDELLDDDVGFTHDASPRAVHAAQHEQPGTRLPTTS